MNVFCIDSHYNISDIENKFLYDFWNWSRNVNHIFYIFIFERENKNSKQTCLLNFKNVKMKIENVF